MIRNQTQSPFYYSRANTKEGRCVAHGLRLFIQDYFKLDPALSCNSESLTEALDREWYFKFRSFLSEEEKIKPDRLNLMEDEINTEMAAYISKDHQ